MSHRGPLGLVYSLLYIELLALGCIDREHRELIKLKAVLERGLCMGALALALCTVQRNPQIMLVLLTANLIPLGL